MASDRDLLFGLTALRNGLIDRERLAAAFSARSLGEAPTMADFLVARGDLDEAAREAVETIVGHQLSRQGGDLAKCLATMGSDPDVTREALTALGDPALTARLSESADFALALDPPTPRAVGAASAEGGRFRVVRPHARGGLGAVFVALDVELNREVALKQILDHRAVDDSNRQRFLLEAEITGGLEHPGIVPVYGLGCSKDGRPFYAMRFIRGDTLKDAIVAFHADPSLRADPGRRALAMRQLLRRFSDVCNAIDYAHGRGVIHRDLKPANVIVGKHGETLVVDWGLAKASGRRDPGSGEPSLIPASASGTAVTLPGSVMGTPAYMSPEQAAGDHDRIDARSDVYSLGATLYTLLTGKLPFEGKVLAILEAVQRGDFPAPRAVDPTVDRALEAICLKAMATSPEARYPTVRALAEDVDRWAADEPVSARAEGWPDRLARRARRHRSATRAAAVALLGVAVAAGVAAVLIDRERGATVRALGAEAESRRVAQERSNLALDAVRDYYSGVSRDFQLKQPELEGLRKSLLRSPLKFYERLAANLRADARGDREARVRLGQAQYDLGRLSAEVGTAAESIGAFEQAQAVQRELALDRPESADDQYRLARTRLDLGNKYDKATRPVDARATFDRALADCEAWLARHPDDWRFAALRAEGLQLRADFRWDHNDLDGARGDYEESARVGRGLARAHPDDLPLVDTHASALNNLYILYRMEEGRHGPAEETLRESIAHRERLVKAAPGDLMYRSNLSSCYQNMAAMFQNTARPEMAREWTEKALAIQEALAREQPNVMVFQERLSATHGNIAAAESNLGRFAAAEPHCRIALEIKERIARARPKQVEPLNWLSEEFLNLARIERGLGKLGEALEAADRGLAAAESCVALNPDRHDSRYRLAASLVGRGELRRDDGRIREALEDMERASTILEDLARTYPDVLDYQRESGQCLGHLATLSGILGRGELAEGQLREGIARVEAARRRDPGEPDLKYTLGGLLAEYADRLGRTGREPAALEAFGRGIAILEEFHREAASDRPGASSLARALGARGALLAQLGRSPEALADFDRALEVAPPEDRRALAYGRALALARAGDRPGALAAVAREGPALASEGEALVRRAAVDAWCEEGDRAMKGLSEARPTRVYREPIRLRVELEGADFDPLRSRTDFRILMEDLTFPVEPIGPGG